MLKDEDEYYYNLSFEQAEKAYQLQEVPVGCVIVYNNQVIGRGHNDVNRTKNPTRHAEFVAIDETNKWCLANAMNFEQVMKESTFYVSLEPCIMCASALYQLNIHRLVYGANNPRFGGITTVASNKDYGHKHEIEIVSEVNKDKSIGLLKKFYNRENPFAPIESRKVKNNSL